MDNELNERMDLVESQFKECDDFFETHEFYTAPDKVGENPDYCYLFDDTWENVTKFIKDNHITSDNILTLIETDGESWVIDGYHYVNRLGYFILKEPLEQNERIELRWR